MKKTFSALIFFLCLFEAENTRAVVITTVPGITSCPNQTIIVPVLVENIANVSSIYLYLDYNILNGISAPGVLTYIGFQNMHPALNNGLIINNSVANNRISMTWYQTYLINISNDTLVELKFTYSSGTTDLDWVTGGLSKYWGFTCGTLPATFINGSVSSAGSSPAILSHPQDSTAYKGGNCSFTVAASAAVSYQWKLSTNSGANWINLADTGVYSGSGSDELQITGLRMDMNNNLYRCYVTGICSPNKYTNPALLNVIPLVKATVEDVNSCPGEVIVPINIEDFLGVAEFSLELDYDSTILSFDTYLNPNFALSSGVMNVSESAGQISIAWISSLPANIPDETLLELKFNSLISDTMCLLSWNTTTLGACRFSDTLNNEFASAYTDGNVTIVICSDITGKVYYDNILAADIADVNVYLNKSSIIVDSTITNASGNYLFTRVPNDTYTINASREGVWKGVNSADALIIARHFVGLDTLTGLQLIAAEVDSSGFINTLDAMAVQQRFVGMISSFPTGDMVFEQDTVTLSDTTTVNVDLCGLFCGDANASYIPYPFTFFVPSNKIKTQLPLFDLKSP